MLENCWPLASPDRAVWNDSSRIDWSWVFLAFWSVQSRLSSSSCQSEVQSANAAKECTAQYLLVRICTRTWVNCTRTNNDVRIRVDVTTDDHNPREVGQRSFFVRFYRFYLYKCCLSYNRRIVNAWWGKKEWMPNRGTRKPADKRGTPPTVFVRN